MFVLGVVMVRTDLHNMHDCMMSRRPSARRLTCRFPYNQRVKSKNTENRSEQTEVTHVKPQTRQRPDCSKADGNGYLLATLFSMLAPEYIIHLAPVLTAGGRGHENVKLWKPFVCFHDLFSHTVRRNNKAGQGMCPY